MKVREYFEKKLSEHPRNDMTDVTFMIARARKDKYTPFYHPEYEPTSLRTVYDWMKNNSKVLDYIILNDKCVTVSWLSGVDWNPAIKDGLYKCLLIISEEDYELINPDKEQREDTERYIETKLDL